MKHESREIEAQRSVASVVAEVWHSEFSLSLIKEDAAFVAGIHIYLQDAIEPNIDELTLRSIYVPLNELIHGDPETLQMRCTRALTRLKSQGILLRADFGGLSTEGEFTLSPLGLSIGDYMDSERTLTKQSLEFVLIRLRAELSQIVAAAQAGGDESHWDSKVVYPLRYVVAEMIAMVDKRQRGLDAAHASLRNNISTLFEQSWTAAVDTCSQMLNSVNTTLGELNAVLTEHGESLGRLLMEIGDCANGHPDVPFLVDRVRNQLYRVLAWSENRYEAWSSYFGTVNEYIRLVIQIDPENRVRARIRDQIRHFPDHPHGLKLVAPEPFLHLRSVSKPTSDEPVTVPDSVLQSRGLTEYKEPLLDPIDAVIEALVARMKEDGEVDIVSAVMEEAPDFTDDQWFTLMSKATPILLRKGLSPRDIVRQRWLPMSPRLEAQTLIIRAPRHTMADTTPPVKEVTHDL